MVEGYTKPGELTEHVRDGILTGLSVGYERLLNNDDTLGVSTHEVSVCKDPYFPKAKIMVTCSKNTKKSDNMIPQKEPNQRTDDGGSHFQDQQSNRYSQQDQQSNRHTKQQEQSLQDTRNQQARTETDSVNQQTQPSQVKPKNEIVSQYMGAIEQGLKEMNPDETRNFALRLCEDFYSEKAEEFSTIRPRIEPGIDKEDPKHESELMKMYTSSAALRKFINRLTKEYDKPTKNPAEKRSHSDMEQEQTRQKSSTTMPEQYDNLREPSVTRMQNGAGASLPVNASRNSVSDAEISKMFSTMDNFSGKFNINDIQNKMNESRKKYKNNY